jgi:hypothetical protein
MSWQRQHSALQQPAARAHAIGGHGLVFGGERAVEDVYVIGRITGFFIRRERLAACQQGHGAARQGQSTHAKETAPGGVKPGRAQRNGALVDEEGHGFLLHSVGYT